MKRHSHISPSLWAALGSALFHGLLFVWLEHGQVPVLIATSPPIAPIELEVIEGPRRPPPAAPVAAPLVSERPSPRPHRRSSPALAVASSQELAEQPDRASPADAPDRPEADASPVPPQSLWRAGEQAALSRGDFPVLQKALPRPSDVREGIQAPPMIQDPNERTSEMIGANLGRDRVDRGLIDPWFSEVSKSLAKGWKPETRLTQDTNLKNYLSQIPANTKVWAKLYLPLAEEYGKTGSPLGDSDVPRDGAQTQSQAIQDFNRRIRAAYRQMRQTLVRITQGAGGLVEGVELVQSSTDPEMDSEILEELKSGAISLPVPPREGRGIKNPIHSVWSFQLVVSVSPPAPVLVGTFDEVLGGFDVRMPLDRRIYKYVQLVSVD